MDPRLEHELLLSRRQFFGNSGIRLGGVALAGLMASQSGLGSGTAKAESGRRPENAPRSGGLPHFAPKAKSSSICT